MQRFQAVVCPITEEACSFRRWPQCPGIAHRNAKHLKIAVMANQPWNSIVYEDHTEIAIIGGGVCGTILAGRCAEQNINFTIVDRQKTLGGVWLEYANQHSSLQVSVETKSSDRL